MNEKKIGIGASSTEGITRNSVNYLHHLLTWSRFVKISKRNCKHFHDLLHFK